MRNKANVKEKNKKEKEKQSVRYYYTFAFGKEPVFIDLANNVKHPDILINDNGQNIAIEVTRYIMNKEEQNDVINRNNIEKFIYDGKVLENIYLYISKSVNNCIPLCYKNMSRLISDILNGTQYIKNIQIGCNHWLQGNKIIVAGKSQFSEMKLNDFLLYFNTEIENGTTIEVFIKNINNISLKISFTHNVIYNQIKDIEIKRFYFGSANPDDANNEIIAAINKKIKKYDLSVSDMKIKNVKYDKYKLLISYLRTPSTINEQKLYNLVRNSINKILFDEIIIVLTNKIMIINDSGYSVLTDDAFTS